MNVRIVQVGQLQTNCYIVWDKSSEALLIDPGDDAEYIEHVCADLELTPIAIVATHGHFDHILAVTELKLAYTIPFLMNPQDEFLLGRMESSSLHFTGVRSLPAPTIDIPLKSGATTLGSFSFEVIETPGHTPGSVCLKFENEVFVGDLLFADRRVGRVDFNYSRPLQLTRSLAKIKNIARDLQLYPGHGDAFYL